MKILEIEIQTEDLNETESFYTDSLGFKVVSKGINFISFLAAQSTLTFIKLNNSNPKYHFAFNIPNNKLDEAIEWAASNFELLKIDNQEVVANFESWNAKSIYFYDNNKNILEFIVRYDIDNAEEKPFDSSSIKCISEIGMVDASPTNFANQFIKENNLNFFEKGSRNEKFVALGNDNGLLIIVQTDWKWYPTDLRAEKYYTRIKIKNDELIEDIMIIPELNKK